MRNGELQGMVDGVGNRGESLEPARRKGLEWRPCRGVSGRILRNGEFLSVLRGQRKRTLRANQVGLVGIVGHAQMRALGSHVAHRDKPVLPQVALHRQVPLLGCCRGPVERDCQRTE